MIFIEPIYRIEEERRVDTYNPLVYRFYSIYNGTRGTWQRDRAMAVKDGEQHQRIIEESLTNYGQCDTVKNSKEQDTKD